MNVNVDVDVNVDSLSMQVILLLDHQLRQVCVLVLLQVPLLLQVLGVYLVRNNRQGYSGKQIVLLLQDLGASGLHSKIFLGLHNH